MTKITIEISDEAHYELLRIQLEKRMKDGVKKPLAVVAAEILQEATKTEKPAK